MTTTSALRVIGYIRVSTNKQDVGPEVQVAALEAEAKAKGWMLEIRREEAASAKSLANRPVLAQALADLKAKRADVLAASKLDRLSRDVADFAGLMKLSTKQGWALVCLDLNVDTTTSTGAAMAQVSVVFAELERKRIAERTSDAMQNIKASGKHMGRSSVLDPETRQRIISDHQAGVSMNRLAVNFNAEGVPTATGGKWYASTIKAVLTSETAKRLLVA